MPKSVTHVPALTVTHVPAPYRVIESCCCAPFATEPLSRNRIARPEAVRHLQCDCAPKFRIVCEVPVPIPP